MRLYTYVPAESIPKKELGKPQAASAAAPRRVRLSSAAPPEIPPRRRLGHRSLGGGREPLGWPLGGDTGGDADDGREETWSHVRGDRARSGVEDGGRGGAIAHGGGGGGGGGEGGGGDDDDEEDEEEDKPIYNPLNLPLGFGKPIPYWLYKLHGLNLEFKCEICGNYILGASAV